MIVVDASLATKWILWEVDSRRALRFLFQPEQDLCAPDLLFIEVARAIVRRANERKDIEDDSIEALRKWTTRWGEHVIKPYRVTQHRLFVAGQLAIRLGHPLADCIYLSLAMELSCELATCDAKFRTRAADIYPKIKLLSEYDLSSVGWITED